MRALRKYNGPNEGKRPTSRAMLLAMERVLNHKEDAVDRVLFAAEVTSWHFMMRSAEYSAKLAQGAFDTDKRMRFKDVRFYIKGHLTTNYARADEVRITFGKSKTTVCGEVRAHFATKHECCVVRALADLFMHSDMMDTEAPLFAWPKGTGMRGDSMRYMDMVTLIKSAAKHCGLDPKEYSSHSQRRGGASATFERCYVTGRMPNLREVEISLFSEAVHQTLGVGNVARAAQANVLSGNEDVDLLAKEPPRERDFMRMRAAKAARKMQEVKSN